MQIIIALSKTQKFNGRYETSASIPVFINRAELIIENLRNLTERELSTLLKTSDSLTRITRRRIDDFMTPFTPENAKQALFTFQGDAYQAVDAENYTAEQLQYAQSHLFILSGLYGALRPLDLMQPYRLEMGSQLQIAEARNLYSLWTADVTKLVGKAVLHDSDHVLINLASAEYSKAVDATAIPGPVIDIIFKQKSKGQYKTIAIHTKRARGMMLDFAIKGKLQSADDLKSFTTDGYEFNHEGSSETQWLFLKKE